MSHLRLAITLTFYETHHMHGCVYIWIAEPSSEVKLTGILRWADNVRTQHVRALICLQQSLVQIWQQRLLFGHLQNHTNRICLNHVSLSREFQLRADKKSTCEKLLLDTDKTVNKMSKRCNYNEGNRLLLINSTARRHSESSYFHNAWQNLQH